MNRFPVRRCWTAPTFVSVLKREELGWWLDATHRDGFSSYLGFRREQWFWP
jgi:hypothetical protein